MEEPWHDLEKISREVYTKIFSLVLKKNLGFVELRSVSVKLCKRSVGTIQLFLGIGENGKNIVLDFNKSKTWKWICNVRNG